MQPTFAISKCFIDRYLDSYAPFYIRIAPAQARFICKDTNDIQKWIHTAWFCWGSRLDLT